ncbi:hypothetical protein LSH36_494g00003 [Paralvinella palmiformis]|uniref:F5/8 type C domain-containing protein n=1 Tax=Paralvinella palmiformis TaxID=53620 RepID=A0AAD9J942_9ANNE|nr:hypothetical protein LSH36_494g00003 [Paralvinella palmiformis]
MQAIPRSVPVSHCERLCSLYSDCVGFNVKWKDWEENNGWCSIISSQSLNWSNPEIIRKGISFYEKRYLGTNIASPSFGTTCTASSYLNEKRNCSKIMNGLLVDRWAAKIGDNKPWIELKFNNTYNIQRIDLYPSCKNVNQCRELEFIFSDGTSIKRSRQCNDIKGENLCSEVPMEMYYVNIIETKCLKILCSNRCLADNGHIGFIEVLLWAVHIMK